MKKLEKFGGQNWLIAPAATAAGQAPPATISEQKWLITLSGVVIADLKGKSASAWHHETLWFAPDLAGEDNAAATSGPLNWAIKHYAIPRPQGEQGVHYLIRFSVELWSPFAALGAVFNEGQSINSGFSVETWRPHAFATLHNVVTNSPANNIFSGIDVDVGVRDSDAWLNHLSYHCTLLGKLVFVAPKF